MIFENFIDTLYSFFPLISNIFNLGLPFLLVNLAKNLLIYFIPSKSHLFIS